MRAGFCAVDITPDVGSRLNGFIARSSPSVGVDLPLHARALVLDSGPRRCLIIGFDVLGLAPPFADRLVSALAEVMGIASDEIILSTSHTHSGPMTAPLRGIGPADENYLSTLEGHAREAARRALDDLRPVEVFWGSAPVEIGINRREIREPEHVAVLGQNPEGPRDRLVRVLQLRTDEGRSIVLFAHACHPYCLGPEHPLISPDFWGYAAQALQAAGHESIYLNGCAADIAPLDPFIGPTGARETGERLATAVLAACAAARREERPDLFASSLNFSLPYDTVPPLNEIEHSLRQPNRTVREQDQTDATVQRRVTLAWEEWLADLRAALGEGRIRGGVRARMSAIRIGGGAIVALPGEVFCGIGDRISALLSAEPVIMAAYCHGFIGYVPEAAAFQFGGYEVDEAHRFLGLWRVSPRSEEVITENVRRLWTKLEVEPQ